MFLILFACLMGACILLAGWKFYQLMDWEEVPEPSPDLRAMHKKEAELLHIQEVLQEARAQGKISQSVIEEFNRYSEAEIQGMKSLETAWRKRRDVNRTREGENDE